jgi:hypothetical protein
MKYFYGESDDKRLMDRLLYGTDIKDRPCLLCRHCKVERAGVGDTYSTRCYSGHAVFTWTVNERTRDASDHWPCGPRGKLFEPIPPVVVHLSRIRGLRKDLLLSERLPTGSYIQYLTDRTG